MAAEVLDTKRTPATWEEYEALGEARWTEYIDGCIVVNPPPGIRHQRASSRLWALLDSTLPEEYTVIEGAGWRPAESAYIPDVMVVRTADIDSDTEFTGTPVLCVEILSSNRSDDQVVKLAKYAEAGLPNYWILDPKLGRLDVMWLGVMRTGGSHYQLTTTLTDQGEVTLDGHALQIDVKALLT